MPSFNPTPTKPIVSYPTASIEELQLITIHDSRLAGYTPLPYGSPYPDQDKFPGLQLVFQGPIGEDDRLVRRIWAGDRGDQDIYNDSRKYSGGSSDHPIIIRKYILPEGSYTPLPTGTPDHNEIGAFLVDEEVTRPENLNGYLAVTRVFESLPGPALTGYVITNDGQLAVTKSQSVLPGATVTPSALLISGSVKPDSKGKSVLETIEVPSVFGAKSYSIEAPDPAPPKFRVAAPATTTWETVAGTAMAPVLATGEIESSEQQATVFTKKLRKTSRSTTALPQTLTQTATTNEGQKATITETLQVGDTTASPTATTTIESEAMGDGTYVVKKTAVPIVFGQKSFSIEVPDPAPQKFRIAAPAITTEETLAGTAAAPVLATGEISASEQQVTVFTKRNRKTARSTTALPQTLTQQATTNDGIKATITETYQTGDDAVTARSALVSVESDALGDGTFVVKKTELASVFAGETKSQEKPDTVPQKFRTSLPAVTTEITEIGSIGTASLASGELSATEQQLTAFTKRTRKTSRVAVTLPKSLTQQATTNDGIKATITETYQTGDDTLTSRSALVSVESDALGDGTFVVKKTELASVFDQQAKSAQKPDVIPERYRASASAKTTTSISSDATTVSDITLGTNELEKSIQRVSAFTKKTSVTSRDNGTLPTLTGQDYDASIGAVVPYTEKITFTGDTLIAALSDVSPLSSDYKLVRTIDTTNLTAALSAISLQFPSRATLSIPPVLESIEVVWDQTTDDGSYASNFTGTAFGTSWSLSGSERAEAKGASSLTPSFVIKMKDTWATNIPTSTHVFFLPTPCTEAHILTALQSKYPSGTVIKRWPVFKPKSDTIVAFGTKVSVTVEGSASASRSVSSSNNCSDATVGKGESKYSSTTSVVANIPSCIHGLITITGATPPIVTAAKAAITSGWPAETTYNFPIVNVAMSATASATGKVNPTSLPATAQTAVPSTGYYLIDSRVELYQHGFVKVYAEVLDASVLA